MANDRNGKPLVVGDVVTIKGVVSEIDDNAPDATVTVVSMDDYVEAHEAGQAAAAAPPAKKKAGRPAKKGGKH